MKNTLRSLVLCITCFISFSIFAAYKVQSLKTLFQVVAEYQQLNSGTVASLKVISPAWHLRYSGGDENGLKTISYQQLKAGVNTPVFPKHMKLNNLHISHQRLAILRYDNIPASETAFIIAFRESGGWKIAADLRANTTCAKHAPIYSHEGEHEAVLQVLGTYYAAVTNEQAQMLDPIFHKDWYMKNHEKGVAVFEGIAAFKKRLQGDKHGTYNVGREISDVQVVNQCLAFVRIDNPLSNGNTFFVFYKQGANWLITDKLWTTPVS